MPKLGQTKIKEEIIDQIITLYNQHNSITDISRKIGIGVAQVWRMLRRRGIETSKRGVFDFRDKLRIYSIDENYFNKIDIPEKAYMLGFLYADGNAHNKFAHITLKLQERDKYILDQMNVLLKHEKPLHFEKKYKSSHQNQYLLKITNKVIYNNLMKWGIVPNKTFIVKFPTFLPNDLLSHFVRGYFDGDGCISIDSSCGAACWDVIGTTDFCKSLQNLLSKLDIISYITHDPRCSIGIDRVRIRNIDGIYKIFKYMYKQSTIHLHRKYDKFIEFLKNKERI